MKLDKSVLSISILTVLIVLVLSMVFLSFFWEGKDTEKQIEIPDNMYCCGNSLVPFRANITDCYNVTIEPSEAKLKGLILNPLAENVFIIVDPQGSDYLGLAASEIYKTFKSLLIKTGVAYTDYYANQSDILVMSVENATTQNPIIWIRENQDKNLIEVEDTYVTIYAKTPYDLDTAACKIAILAINDKFDCNVPEE